MDTCARIRNVTALSYLVLTHYKLHRRPLLGHRLYYSERPLLVPVIASVSSTATKNRNNNGVAKALREICTCFNHLSGFFIEHAYCFGISSLLLLWRKSWYEIQMPSPKLRHMHFHFIVASWQKKFNSFSAAFPSRVCVLAPVPPLLNFCSCKSNSRLRNSNSSRFHADYWPYPRA